MHRSPRNRPCSLPRFQCCRHLRPKIVNISCAQGHTHVPWICPCHQFAYGFIERRCVASIAPAEALDGFCNVLCTHAGDWRLAGCIDVEHPNVVGIRKSCSKFPQQVLSARVAMRLENHVNLLGPALPCCRQGSAYLRGMMAIIIDHADVPNLALKLEAPVDAP